MGRLVFKETRNIAASQQAVFDAVVDLDNYKLWNPWIADAKGHCQEGEYITVTAVMKNKRPKFIHKILEVKSPDYFHWCDVGFFTLFAYGHRERFIKVVDDTHCEYTCELEVTGMGTIFAELFFGKFMAEGMQAEADALQAYVENK